MWVPPRLVPPWHTLLQFALSNCVEDAWRVKWVVGTGTGRARAMGGQEGAGGLRAMQADGLLSCSVSYVLPRTHSLTW